MKYPIWFPFPTCWLKAFFLLLLVGSIVTSLGQLIGNLGEIAARLTDRPDLFLLTTVLVFLSPIPAIALVHFLMHFLLGKIASGLQSPEAQKHPVLMSVWEGLYGWMATVIATSIAMIIASSDPDFFNLIVLNQKPDDYQLTFIGITWLIIAATLYQVEYRVLSQRS
jgi:hypothetical protein